MIRAQVSPVLVRSRAGAGPAPAAALTKSAQVFCPPLLIRRLGLIAGALASDSHHHQHHRQHSQSVAAAATPTDPFAASTAPAPAALPHDVYLHLEGVTAVLPTEAADGSEMYVADKVGDGSGSPRHWDVVSPDRAAEEVLAVGSPVDSGRVSPDEGGAAATAAGAARLSSIVVFRMEGAASTHALRAGSPVIAAVQARTSQRRVAPHASGRTRRRSCRSRSPSAPRLWRCRAAGMTGRRC